MNDVFSSKVTNTELHDNHILIQAMKESETDQEKAKSIRLFLLYWSPTMTVMTVLMVTPYTCSTVSEEDNGLSCKNTNVTTHCFSAL